MTGTSGTYNFNPPLGSLALAAFSRIGIRRTELLAEHMENAYLETNLLQADWGADGITWWTVELITIPLIQGVGLYDVAPHVVSVLDVYINNGFTNRILFPFSRTDFASLADPTEQGVPTSFWWNRLINSTLNLWPLPDSDSQYTLSYYAYTQIMDSNFRQGGNVDVPVFWLDAYVADLAYRLSRHYAPSLEAVRKTDRDEAYARACKQVETTPLYITAGLESYYRN